MKIPFVSKPLFSLLICLLLHAASNGQQALDSLLPVRGFAIAAPSSRNVDSFVVFINKELAPKNVNTLILRIDFSYQFKSRPELIDDGALSEAEVKKNSSGR